jgi:DNA polymerase-3 subunit gamma/tau
MSDQLMLKYRPRKFADVIGQDHVTQTLCNSITGKDMHQTYIFSGPFGDGKTSCARILAASENCEKGPTLEPCGECANCRSIFEGIHPDVKELNAASNRNIEDIRNLSEWVRDAPLEARMKYVILDECHSLTPQAAEAALKVLEEPPDWVRFILCTTDIQKMKLTIHSRCMPFRFSKVGWPQLLDHMKRVANLEKYQFDEAALRVAARLSRGSVRNCLNNLQLLHTFAGDQPITQEVAQKALGAVGENDYFGLVEAILDKDAAAGFKIIQQIFVQGQDVETMLSGLIEHVRNLLVICTSQNTAGLLFLSEEEKKRYIHQVGKMKQTMNSALVLLPIEMIKLLSDVSKGISLNISPQTLLESFLIQSIIVSADLERKAKEPKK